VVWRTWKLKSTLSGMRYAPWKLSALSYQHAMGLRCIATYDKRKEFCEGLPLTLPF
jgi:hypothetical protein